MTCLYSQMSRLIFHKRHLKVTYRKIICEVDVAPPPFKPGAVFQPIRAQIVEAKTRPNAQLRICACAAFLSLTVWEGQRWLRPWPAGKWIGILWISTFFPYFLLQYGKLHSLIFCLAEKHIFRSQSRVTGDSFHRLSSCTCQDFNASAPADFKTSVLHELLV